MRSPMRNSREKWEMAEPYPYETANSSCLDKRGEAYEWWRKGAYKVAVWQANDNTVEDQRRESQESDAKPCQSLQREQGRGPHAELET